MKIQKTEENVLACLAANALANRCEFLDLFDETVTPEEIAAMAAKNQIIAYNTIYNYHNKINADSKLILLQGFIDNDNFLKDLFEAPAYNFKITIAEYSLITSYLLSNDKYDLLLDMFRQRGLNKNDAKKFKIDKELKEKWNGFLIMNELIGE